MLARSVCVALLLILIPSTLLFLLSARLGVAQQSINICLDGDDLLHIPARFLIPVSYTHLDVYKRQHLKWLELMKA